MYVAFVDFRKALDSVRHCMKGRCIWQMFRGHKGHVHFFVILFNTVKICIQTFSQCASCVRQGCVLGPTLFYHSICRTYSKLWQTLCLGVLRSHRSTHTVVCGWCNAPGNNTKWTVKPATFSPSCCLTHIWAWK